MKHKTLTWLIFLLLGCAIFILFSTNQISTELADPDAFYHMKIAQLIAQQGIIKDFWWLPYTTLSQYYIDQHLLFHIITIPFVTWLEPFVGIKLLVPILGTATLLTLAWLMRSLRLRWWLPLTIILALTVTFTFRINLVKATPLSLIILFALIYCLAKQRFWLLALLSILYVWTYGGFAMALIISIVWWISQLIFAWQQRMLRTKQLWLEQLRGFGFLSGGLLLGIIVNPYFPANLWFYWDQLIQIGVINYQKVISVGSEWYPYEPSQLFLSSLLLTFAAGLSFSIIIIKRQRFSQLDWFGVGLLFIGCMLTFKSRRYVEYFGPFVTLAAAIWFNHLVLPTIRQIWQWFEKNKSWQIIYYSMLLSVIMLQFTLVILHDTNQNVLDVRSGISITKYQAAGTWMQQNAMPYTKILHSDWDDFPSLFYYNSNNAYMAGLDPTFMYRYNQDLYWLWVNITTGKFTGDITTALTTLDVKYVIVEQDHTAMDKLIKTSTHTKSVYVDDEVTIYQVL